MKSLKELALARITREQLVADTVELIRAGGENPGDTEKVTVETLKLMCERIGATVELQEFLPDRENLYATLGPEDGPAILFLGHSDVVPAGDGWLADPFEPRVTEDVIIGRGSTDMKGGLAAIVSAMATLHTVAPDLRLELLCTGDEEDRSLGVRAMLQTTLPKQYLACIVAEPTDLDVVIGCRGASNLVFNFVGASAHAGRPEDGASSIYAASRLIELVRRLHQKARDGEEDSLLGTVSWNVGTIEGGSGTSMVPRETSVTVDRRTMPGEKTEDILNDLLETLRTELEADPFANSNEVEITGFVDMEMPGFRVAEDSDLAQIAGDAMRELGRSGSLTGWTAACEGGFINRLHNVPTIVLGPGDINNQAHQPEEQVVIEDLVTAAQAYVLIALTLGKAI